MSLGEKLRSIREERGLTLARLAAAAGLSRAYVSQLENDKANPSLGSLKAVMDALGLPLAALFNDHAGSQPVSVVRKTERKTYTLPDLQVRFELLSPDLNRKMEFLLTTVEPGVDTGPRSFVHSGEECGVILCGKLKLRVGDQEYILEEGDSVYYDSTIPHSWENIGDEPVQSIWVISPPSF